MSRAPHNALQFERSAAGASGTPYDLIVIGGGIYGAMLSLEASLRGIRVLLLEKEKLGGKTSLNSLRTIHSGLRRLQAMDVKGYRRFARELQWFLEHFPDLVRPLPVLVPLYQRGFLRIGAFRTAFLLARLASPSGSGVGERAVPPARRILSASRVQDLFPEVDTRSLRGGALWHDATIPDPQGLIREIVRCACSVGATVLEDLSVEDLLTEGKRVIGVRATETHSGVTHEFMGPVVVNAAGPWSREIARRFDRDVPALFRPSLGWNVVFDRPAISECAVALAPARANSRVYFFHSLEGRLLVGTGHAPREVVTDSPEPSTDELDRFLAELNEALPGAPLRQAEIAHVYAGFLPVEEERTIRLRTTDRLFDHGQIGGPRGLFSICGTRFTTARSMAVDVLARIYPGRRPTVDLKECRRGIRGNWVSAKARAPAT